MTLSFQSFVQWVQQQAAAVQTSATVVINYATGSTLRAVLEANASVALWLQWLIALLLQTTRAATSVGPDLDTFMADFGFTRIAAVSSTGLLTFTRASTTNAAFVPIGATFKTSDGSQSFTVYASASATYYSAALGGYTIPAGVASAAIPIQAVNAGTQGNVAAGTISLAATGVAYVDSVSNAVAFVNGVDAQTDASARLAFQGYISTRSRATTAAVIFAVQQVGANLTCAVAENLQADLVTYAPGHFTVWVDDGSGAPSVGLLATCYSAVDAVRPIGSTFAVLAPVVVGASVSFALTAAPGYTVPTLDALAAAAVTTFIQGQGMGVSVPYNRLASIIFNSSPGIVNVSGLVLNGGTADIGGAKNQIVRVTSVSAG